MAWFEFLDDENRWWAQRTDVRELIKILLKWDLDSNWKPEKIYIIKIYLKNLTLKMILKLGKVSRTLKGASLYVKTNNLSTII